MDSMDDDAVDKVVTISLAAALGAILVSALVIPVFNDMLTGLTDAAYGGIDNLDTVKTLLGIVLIIVVVAFIIAIVRGGLRTNR